jgi:hypothetical protein
MTDPGTETAAPLTGTVDVRGRTITIKKLVDTQMMLLAREAKILQRDDIGNDRKLDGIDRMFTILESVVVEPKDKVYLEDLMAKGELDLRELVSFVTTFNAQGAEKPARVRRARATAKR